MRNGDHPVLHLSSSRSQQVAELVKQVHKLHEAGYQPHDIAVLYRRKTRKDTVLFNQLIEHLSNLGLGCYWVTENEQTKANYCQNREGVRLITALSSLGLEFKAVLIPWVEQFGDRYSQEPKAATIARRQLYVAITRAQDELYLFGSGSIPILDELRQSQYFEVVAVS